MCTLRTNRVPPYRHIHLKGENLAVPVVYVPYLRHSEMNESCGGSEPSAQVGAIGLALEPLVP